MSMFTNKEKSRRWIAPVVLTAALLGSALVLTPTVSAGDGWGERGEHRGEHRGMHSAKDGGGFERFRKMADHLDFTEEQQMQLEIILSKAKAKAKANVDESGGRRAMRDMMMSIDPEASDYDEQVVAAADKMANQVKAKVLAMAEVRKEIHGMLTDEQKAQVEKYKAKRQEKMKKHQK